jgi:hypothetical protein
MANADLSGRLPWIGGAWSSDRHPNGLTAADARAGRDPSSFPDAGEGRNSYKATQSDSSQFTEFVVCAMKFVSGSLGSVGPAFP